MPLARPPVPPWLILKPTRNRRSHRKDFLAALLSFFSYILTAVTVIITEHSTMTMTIRFSAARSITDCCVVASTQICRIFLIWSITKIWPNYLSVFVMVCCTQHKSLPHLSLNQCLSYTWIPMSNSISYKCKDIAGTWWVLMNTSCLICQTLNTANDVQTVANGQDLRPYTNPLWRCYEFCSFSPHLLIAAFFETSWIASVSVVLTLTKFLRQYNSKSTVRSSLNWMGFGQNAVIEWNTDCRTKWHQIISSGSFTSRGILPTNSVPEICFSSNTPWI